MGSSEQDVPIMIEKGCLVWIVEVDRSTFVTLKRVRERNVEL